MIFTPARKVRFLCWWKKILFVLPQILLIILVNFFILGPVINPVYAQTTPTPATQPTSNLATWEFDPIVTEVGKNADRARQLLWWLFQHPGIHTAPVIAQIWSFVRNIVLIFVVMVIIAFGVSLILGKRRGAIGPIFSGISSPVMGVNVPIIFIRIAGILLYVMFSYVMIVALIQTSDIIMRFFIEAVGGKDLFNIIFSGAGNTEANYITFVGYKDINPLSQEMVSTSLFYIKLTTLTYNVMSTILVLRTIILWFLLIIAPFLALLMPFVFIRNTGWIWIGVFFQWLFYGPIFALFLAALTRIWVAGIPYSFDFSRVNKPSGQVYRTAINILWGGPAQTLSPGNSANYVDTYAEYFIALVMLWAAVILPWFLLRIFRDYCCSMIAAGTNTLNSIFDRLRQFPTPPPTVPGGPASTSNMAVELPFRQSVSEKVRDIQHVKIEEIKTVSNVSTNEIARSMDMSVSRLSDISRMETNMMKKSEVNSYLDKIRQPDRIATSSEREKFKEVRQELVQRALKGDRIAQTLLQASDRQTQALTTQILSQGKTAPIKISVSPQVTIEATVPAITNKSVVEQVSGKMGISEIRTRDVVSKISVEEISNTSKVEEVAKSTGVSTEKVKEIVQQADQVWKTSFAEYSQDVKQISAETKLSETKTREILSKITESEVNNIEKVKEVSKVSGVSEEKVKEVINAVTEVKKTKEKAKTKEIAQKVAQQSSIKAETSQQILENITEKDLTNTDKVKEVAQKSGVTEEKVKEVVKSAEKVKASQKKQEAVTKAPSAPVAPTQVSVEDYEEVKQMWLKHFRSAPVPVSENIKTRTDWLTTEEKQLTNITNLLSSTNPALKQQGLDKVSDILPFMLLGGFSEQEILTYIKAKLEADRQVIEESAIEEKAKEKAKEELKLEEDDVMVDAGQQEKAEKAETLSMSQEIPEVETAQGNKSPSEKNNPPSGGSGGQGQNNGS